VANEAMYEYWNGVQAEAWVRSHANYESMLEPMIDPILSAARLQEGEAVLDIGCGSGALARAAAERVGTAGSVTGLDISEGMVELARRLSPSELTFTACDVQTADLSEVSADVAVSRFGVMFFDDPVAAFRNIGAAVRPGGRIAFACWQSPMDNPWVSVPMSAIVPILGVPDLPQPGAPGPFQMADTAFVRTTLAAAGWRDIAVAPHELDICIGAARDVDEAVVFLINDGVARRLFEGRSDEIRAEAEDALRKALEPHVTPDGVMLRAAPWIVTASRL